MDIGNEMKFDLEMPGSLCLKAVSERNDQHVTGRSRLNFINTGRRLCFSGKFHLDSENLGHHFFFLIVVLILVITPIRKVIVNVDLFSSSFR